MYKLGNMLLLIALTIIILAGGGIILKVIPASSPIIAPASVISLLFIGAGASLKKKYKNTGH